MFSIYLLILVVTVVNAAVPNCGGGYRFYNGNCYKVIKISKSWFDAQAYCESNGASLASITNVNEANFVRTLRSGGQKWIGGIEEAEGQWGWVDRKAPFAWTNWWYGEPNDRTQDNCLVLKSCWFRWADGNCQSRQEFICKRSI